MTDEYRRAVKKLDVLLADPLATVLVTKMSSAFAANGRKRMAKIVTDFLDYHTSTKNLVEMAESANVKQLVFHHMVPMPANYFMENVFRRGVPDEVVIADDGMRFILAADSDEIVVE